MSQRKRQLKKLRTRQTAQGILASVEACRSVVAAFANHTQAVPAGKQAKPSDLRAAPGFARGKNLDAPGAVLYTSRHVAEVLAIAANAPNFLRSGGKNVTLQAGRWVMVGMALLEHFEEHPYEEAEILQRIKNCERGYGLRPLLKRLAEQRKLTNIFASAGENTRSTCDSCSENISLSQSN